MRGKGAGGGGDLCSALAGEAVGVALADHGEVGVEHVGARLPRFLSHKPAPSRARTAGAEGGACACLHTARARAVCERGAVCAAAEARRVAGRLLRVTNAARRT